MPWELLFSVQVIFSPGVSLQDFFPLKKSVYRIFFSEIAHTMTPAPHPQKSNGWPLIRGAKRTLVRMAKMWYRHLMEVATQ